MSAKTTSAASMHTKSGDLALRKISTLTWQLETEVSMSSGIGHYLFGCWTLSLHVSSLLGVSLGDNKAWQALLYKPSRAREIADACTCYSDNIDVILSMSA